MQIRKVIIFLIIFPALVGLACLQTAAPASTPLAPTATPILEELRAAVPTVEAVLIEPAPTKKPICARITADEALHLRAKADPQARVLGYMMSGEVVRLLSTTNPEWWLVKREGKIGYARAKYLAKSKCEQ